MKSEIDKCDYDVCLIGCGAYGFPLAAHVKHKGKQAIIWEALFSYYLVLKVTDDLILIVFYIQSSRNCLMRIG